MEWNFIKMLILYKNYYFTKLFCCYNNWIFISYVKLSCLCYYLITNFSYEVLVNVCNKVVRNLKAWIFLTYCNSNWTIFEEKGTTNIRFNSRIRTKGDWKILCLVKLSIGTVYDDYHNLQQLKEVKLWKKTTNKSFLIIFILFLWNKPFGWLANFWDMLNF